jgi:DNA-binding NarL/FixJ family response regulator
MKEKPTIPLLTSREREILLLLAKGFTSKEIADYLYVSKETIDKHRKNMLHKHNCKNSIELLNYIRQFLKDLP